MSQHADYIEVANPTTQPHWIKVHTQGHHTMEIMEWDKYCRRCPLRPILRTSNVHTTWFLARQNKLFLDIIAREKDYEKFLRGLNKSEIKFNVSHTGKVPSNSRSKGPTINQIHAVRLALREGYYDSPRKTDTIELSHEFGCSPSTLCETLRRAEKNIMQEYLDLFESDQVEKRDHTEIENDSSLENFKPKDSNLVTPELR